MQSIKFDNNHDNNVNSYDILPMAVLKYILLF